MLWKEQILTAAERDGQPDILNTNVDTGETDSPYYLFDTLERWAYEGSLDKLRTISGVILDGIGSPAIQSVTALPGYNLPRGTLDCLGASIYVNGVAVESVEVDAATYYQLANIGQYNSAGDKAAVYSFIGGKVQFQGTAINLVLLVEPRLSLFQADAQILPDGSSEDVIDFIHKQMLTGDLLPAGRL